jgi:hypothetical protein
MKFDLRKLRENSGNVRLFLLDLTMVGLAVLYLLWSVFDALLRTQVAARLLQEEWGHTWASEAYALYTALDSIFYDTLFVSVFLGELLLRWAWAIYRKTYHRWFFYPFVHWYDTLGCIPVTSFKFFRILRIFFVGQRLHEQGVLDLSGTFLYEVIRKYSKVVVEELSDRVVVNIISGMQAELHRGTPLVRQVVAEVIAPHQPQLVEWLSHRLQQAAAHAQEVYGEPLHRYIDGLIEEAVRQNREIGQLERIPVVGSRVGAMLERAISDIVNQVLARALQDLASPHNREVLQGVADLAVDAAMFQEDDARLDQLVRQVAHRSLELLKEHVRVQQWKLDEEQ